MFPDSEHLHFFSQSYCDIHTSGRCPPPMLTAHLVGFWVHLSRVGGGAIERLHGPKRLLCKAMEEMRIRESFIKVGFVRSNWLAPTFSAGRRPPGDTLSNKPSR